MKKIKFLSTILLAVMTMSMMVACSSSNDEDGVDVSYTESEIVELLKGTWYVSGELKVVKNDKRLEGNYTGSIEFKENHRYKTNITTNCTYNDLDTYGESDNEYMSYVINKRILCYDNYDYDPYKVVKKDGKMHIEFKGHLDTYHTFRIVKLSKNELKLVLDQDSENYLGHVYMTIVSN